MAVFMGMAVKFARFFYLFFKPFKVRNQVLIMSRQSNKSTVDIKYISEELKNRGIKCKVLTKRLNKGILKGIGYGFHMLRQMYNIAISKVIILDGYCILTSILDKKEGQKVIQIWHALGAVKKFGWQSVGKEDGNSVEVSSVMRLYNNIDYAIAPSFDTAKVFSKAFRIGENKIKRLGLPRIDYLLSENTKICDDIEKFYSVEDRDVVLYAPTFRKGRGVDIGDLIDNFDFSKYVLVLKKHWLDKTDYSKYARKNLIVDSKFSSMDWLRVCRKVITDYSAIIFEASLMGKEIYLYLNDIDRYGEKLGLNIDFTEESLKDYVYYDSESLVRGIEEDYDKGRVEDFKNKYIQLDLKGSCTEELVNFLEDCVGGKKC